MPTYAELLKDPRWQKRRLEVLQAAGWKCEWCDAKDRTLHVHHKKYRKGAKPWEYPDDELEVLCEEHHNCIRSLKEGLEEALARLPSRSWEGVVAYAWAIHWENEIRETDQTPDDKPKIGAFGDLCFARHFSRPRKAVIDLLGSEKKWNLADLKRAARLGGNSES